ncbi:hypothetical protein F4825DRAFT_445324 [Nemania diffusa]|nr:hypothetical protein F4825DRAFT_445324 [Nemania diffusa]
MFSYHKLLHRRSCPMSTGGFDADVLLLGSYPADGSSPVHTSGYNPNDKRDILSAKIKLEDGSIAPGTHHIFEDGRGTVKKDETPR